MILHLTHSHVYNCSVFDWHTGCQSWQRVRDRIACSSDKPCEKAVFSKIAISEVGGSHGHNVVNGFKGLCGDAPAVSLVGL